MNTPKTPDFYNDQTNKRIIATKDTNLTDQATQNILKENFNIPDQILNKQITTIKRHQNYQKNIRCENQSLF